MKKILCMFSGGLDSIGMLYKLLTEDEYANYIIHVHHINMINIENRSEAEKIAVDNCCDWFKKNGKKFIYTENTIDFLFMKNNFPFDVDVIYFVAGQIISISLDTYEYITIGQTKTDLTHVHGIQGINLPRSKKLLDIMLAYYDKDIKRIFPVIDYTKKEIYDFLPEDLKNMGWSCRTPQKINDIFIKCGRCKSCKELKDNNIT